MTAHSSAMRTGLSDDYAIWADEHRSDDRALALLMRMGMSS